MVVPMWGYMRIWCLNSPMLHGTHKHTQQGHSSPGSDMMMYFSLIVVCCTHCMMAYGLQRSPQSSVHLKTRWPGHERTCGSHIQDNKEATVWHCKQVYSCYQLAQASGSPGTEEATGNAAGHCTC